MKQLLIALACCVLAAVPAWGNDGVSRQGKNYYLDAMAGNDANDGLSAGKAWRNLSRVDGLVLMPGDSLLLRRGTTFTGKLELRGNGTAEARVVIDAYGVGKKPCVVAPDSSLYAIQVRNADYLTLRNLEVVNKGTARMAKRTGVKVACEDYGTSRSIILEALDIHDVNGSLVKKEGGGSGILIVSKWRKGGTVSVYDGLTITHCAIRCCERNAIIWEAPWSRKDWHLSRNVRVCYNLIEKVPGDGIVPIGCDGAVVEYNLMRDCPATLPDGEAAAGFWPWSCDNTMIRYNEVSDHHAPWDAQGFDCDFNCTNTTIAYNYSHDNDGGFVLICNAGKGETDPADNIGNVGSVVRYNVSIGDGVRQHVTQVGMFSPTIHVSGPCENTLVERNILHVEKKPAPQVARKVITSDSWGGYANATTFKENVFYAPEPSAFDMRKSTNNLFDGNYYMGTFDGKPVDVRGKDTSEYYDRLLQSSADAKHALSFLFGEVSVGNGAAVMKVVRADAIRHLFEKMKTGK